HLVGHSGGGAMSLLVLERLPPEHKVTSVVLLSAAISPRYPIDRALEKTELGIWNFYNPLELPVWGLATAVVGTMDGDHLRGAGALGFYNVSRDRSERMPKLTQIGYTPGMILDRNLGGHFGWCNTVFVRNRIAPVLLETQKQSIEIARRW